MNPFESILLDLEQIRPEGLVMPKNSERIFESNELSTTSRPISLDFNQLENKLKPRNKISPRSKKETQKRRMLRAKVTKILSSLPLKCMNDYRHTIWEEQTRKKALLYKINEERAQKNLEPIIKLNFFNDEEIDCEGRIYKSKTIENPEGDFIDSLKRNLTEKEIAIVLDDPNYFIQDPVYSEIALKVNKRPWDELLSGNIKKEFFKLPKTTARNRQSFQWKKPVEMKPFVTNKKKTLSELKELFDRNSESLKELNKKKNEEIVRVRIEREKALGEFYNKKKQAVMRKTAESLSSETISRRKPNLGKLKEEEIWEKYHSDQVIEREEEMQKKKSAPVKKILAFWNSKREKIISDRMKVT